MCCREASHFEMIRQFIHVVLITIITTNITTTSPNIRQFQLGHNLTNITYLHAGAYGATHAGPNAANDSIEFINVDTHPISSEHINLSSRRRTSWTATESDPSFVESETSISTPLDNARSDLHFNAPSSHFL